MGAASSENLFALFDGFVDNQGEPDSHNNINFV
ncbi:MAG: hypothetical protein K0R23_3726 [Lacrimispora sp.]|nr:hypothetical protein [Lacrimispora sp.]